mmetsp:Transcript_8467/g.12481  ORF Transcript_8467/g.12481 Transcript_8467/m.12481 type:complete len:112 (+) Transcript_8467:96-431(+)
MKVWVAVVVLILCGLSLVVFADDFDVCSYTDANCDDDEECSDGDNGDCVDLDVDDTNDIGVRAICEDGEPQGSIQAWNSDDCNGIPLARCRGRRGRLLLRQRRNLLQAQLR